MSAEVDLLVVFATFAIILPAELPDKSMLATVVMATRNGALPTWLGVASAFACHVAVAVTAGQLVTYFPRQLVMAIATTFFLVAGVYLLSSKRPHFQEPDEGELEKRTSKASFWKMSATAFGVIFVSEWGDLTQIATINLTARYQDPWSVALGSISALWLIAGLGVVLGNRLVKVVPFESMKRIAGLMLIGLGTWSLMDWVRN